MSEINQTQYDEIRQSAIGVANIAALPAAPVNGQTIWVRSVLDEFRYLAGSVVAADGITVIASAAGRWFRAGLANQYWVNTWGATKNVYLSDATGNDENVGSAASPLKTPAELDRRLHGLTFYGDGTVSLIVNVVDDAAATQPINVSWNSAGDPGQFSYLLVRGARTQVNTGTISAVTAFNDATNTTFKVTDGAKVWAPYVGKLILFYSAGVFVCSAWIQEDLGGGQARLTVPSAYEAVDSTLSAFAVINALKLQGGTPAIGDTYKIYDLPEIPDLNINVNVQNFVFGEALRATNAVGFAALNGQAGYFALFGCDVDVPTYSAFLYLRLINCRMAPIAFAPVGAQGFFSHFGAFHQQIETAVWLVNSYLGEIVHTTFENCPVVLENPSGVFDVTGQIRFCFIGTAGADCLTIQGNRSALRIDSLWGTGNAGAALAFEAEAHDSRLFLNSVPPIVAATDIQSGAQSMTFAAVTAGDQTFQDPNGNQVTYPPGGYSPNPFSTLKFSGAHTGAVGAAVSYLADGGPVIAALLAAAVGYPSPPRTYRKLRVRAPTNPLAAAMTATVYKNGVATALTVTVTAASTALFTDATHTVTFAPGDNFDLRLDSTAAGAINTALVVATLEGY